MTTTHRIGQFPLLFSLSVIAAVLGFSLLVEPALSDNSAALTILPIWGLVLWGFSFLLGGLGVVYGLLAHRGDYESAGCTLQGFAYLAAAVATLFSTTVPVSPLGVAMTMALATGFIWRAYAIRNAGV